MARTKRLPTQPLSLPSVAYNTRHPPTTAVTGFESRESAVATPEPTPPVDQPGHSSPLRHTSSPIRDKVSNEHLYSLIKNEASSTDCKPLNPE